MSVLTNSIEHALAVAAHEVVKVQVLASGTAGRDAGDLEGRALPHPLVAKLSVE